MKNIHVIPTDKPSRLRYFNGKLELMYLVPKKSDIVFQNIYITSDEEIKNCCVLSTHTNEVYFLNGYYGIQPINKKIILTTDQDLIKIGVQAIDDEFLEWFVKNPSCEEVEVKKGKMKLNDDGEEYGFPDMSLYKIIIPKEEPKTILERLPFPELVKEFAEYYKNVPLVEEPKQETLEEAAEKEFPLIDTEWCRTGACEEENLQLLGHRRSFIKGAKWQQEQFKNESTADYIDRHIVQAMVETAKQERRYSEEEVLEIVSNCDGSISQAKKWFEQYKKK